MSTPTLASRPSRPSRPPAALPSVWSVGRARTVLELKMFFREKDAVIFVFAFPVILLLIFGAVFDADVGGGVSFTQYFLAGMVASGLLLVSFQNLAMTIAMERDDGTLKRLEGTPMPRAAYFIGKIGVVVVAGVAQIAVLLLAGVLVFGIDLPSDPARWLVFAWVALLGLVSGTLLGIAFSSVPRSGRSANAVVAPVVLVLQFISGVFFIYSELPTWIQQVAAVFPLKWLAQGMRSVFLPDSFAAQEVAGSWEHVQTALVLGGWSVLGLVLCLTTFRWRRRDDG